MLGALCIRPKPWLFSFLSLTSSTQHRLIQSPLKLFTTNTENCRRHNHSTACRIGCYRGGGAASIWHAILPAGGNYIRPPAFHEQKGEGSWNVAWDDRPARWLHRPDSAWLLFGVCGCIGGAREAVDSTSDANNLSLCLNLDAEEEKSEDSVVCSEEKVNYRVTGVPADGRCLFRAIAHVTCLRNGEEAPDENRQRDLADDLRAEVVAELLRRRKETEWFIEGDFDTYVERIQRPYVWGGEPELLMASHVLKTKISVFMLDRSSDSLINIANYGEEYQKSDEIPIKLLFHGYGHYDIVEVPNNN
ncbi:hypothetical protein DCAR_0521786 [Daucus carota subsp. sativus]|uniref:Ubiquitin thioesterase OTU n=1 Tax=Daucus carota subsp. sativus TaxID=79200 RepID=A0A164ZE18_DAUCS|nr:PREDICTED: uncharacterized protein LOC108220073 [Daucus carota subsp. sativus]WOH02397.1 hypothetical protein DCAR_0521786 [Daucus carota subsp. sativus]